MGKKLSLIASMLVLSAASYGQVFIGSKTSTKTSTRNGVTTTVVTEKNYTAEGKVYITTTTTYSNSSKKKVEKTVGYEKLNETGNQATVTTTEHQSTMQSCFWSEEELAAAHTTSHVPELSPQEAMTIAYINLARLYPKKFAEKEVLRLAKDRNSPYVKSLVQKLNTMKPLPAFQFSKTMYDYAKCFAIESGEAGKTGHVRSKCKGGNFAECCCYGLKDGEDIVLMLLIDEGVPSLGHRNNCLSAEHKKIGCSIQKHKKSGTCCIIDIER